MVSASIRASTLAWRLQGPQAGALFLSQGRHARLHQGGDRLQRAQERLRQGRDRHRRRFGRSGRRRRTSSATSTISRSRSPPTRRKKMLTAYGVWGEKSMYGRKFMGIRRTTFLIGRDGRIAQGVGERQSPRPCRRRARGGQGAVRCAVRRRAWQLRARRAWAQPLARESRCQSVNGALGICGFRGKLTM